MDNAAVWKGGMDKYGLKKLNPGDTTSIPFEDRRTERLIRKAVGNRNARNEDEYYSVRKSEGTLNITRKS